MAQQQEADQLVLRHGEEKSLPHTLSTTRHLTLVLIDADPGAGTATLELRNPEAEPDAIVSGLVEEAVEDVEGANDWREKLHLPEKAVPVDSSTAKSQRLVCKLDEKLEIGDRVWTVTDIAEGQVTLSPGRDRESDTLINKIEDLAYGRPAIDAAEKLDTIDRGL
jgi:hypothetical protein